MSKYEQIDLSKVKLYPLKERKNLVKISDFALPVGKGSSFKDFLNSLSRIKDRTDAGSNLRDLIFKIWEAKKLRKPIIWGLGPHVIKYGLSLLIINLMDNGFVTAIATNGAGAIHDTEIALIGETSEEMTGKIDNGTFGMAKETGEFINNAVKRAYNENLGLGESIGKSLIENNEKYISYSLLANAYKRGIPATVHVAIGTDIIHMHPNMDGLSTGYATLADFKIFAYNISKIKDGGVYINIGSSVVLPEVFLKSLTVANNIFGDIKGFTTANIDHLSEYRPLMNVVKRPTFGIGIGYEIICRLEIIIPLISRLLLEE